jgi:hypothetical protein
MAKASTIKYAQENLSPEEFAAWEAMPTKLSKAQLKAGERPPMGEAKPAAKAKEQPKAEPKKGKRHKPAGGKRKEAVCATGGCVETIPGGVQGVAHCEKHANQPEAESPMTENCHDCNATQAGWDLHMTEDDDGNSIAVCTDCYVGDLPNNILDAIDNITKASDQEEVLRAMLFAFWASMDERSKLAAVEHEDIIALLEEFGDDDEDEDEEPEDEDTEDEEDEPEEEDEEEDEDED